MASTRSTARQSNVRTILHCETYAAYEEIRIDVCGTGFLYNQVRNMVGTLLEVGRGKWPAERVTEILKSRDRQNAGPTVPACGLCLQWVQYPPDHLIGNIPEHDDSARRKHSVEVSS
jgi:tRNA pseudouridine38-40 synthase